MRKYSCIQCEYKATTKGDVEKHIDWMMNLAQLLAWCRIEFNKDYIEQGLKSVNGIPWGKIRYTIYLSIYLYIK